MLAVVVVVVVVDAVVVVVAAEPWVAPAFSADCPLWVVALEGVEGVTVLSILGQVDGGLDCEGVWWTPLLLERWSPLVSYPLQLINP